jgi:hypothetical protein
MRWQTIFVLLVGTLVFSDGRVTVKRDDDDDDDDDDGKDYMGLDEEDDYYSNEEYEGKGYTRGTHC